jgi:hypothetical protein
MPLVRHSDVHQPVTVSCDSFECAVHETSGLAIAVAACDCSELDRRLGGSDCWLRVHRLERGAQQQLTPGTS